MTKVLATLFIFIVTLMPVAAFASQQASSASEGEGESREAPHAGGRTGEVADYELKIVDVMLDATDVVLAENQWNDPPEQGNVFFIARVEVTYTGRDTGTPWIDLSFNVVGDKNRGYSQSNAPCGSIPDEASDAPELFEDGSAEFNLCWSVPEEETESLVMYVQESFSWDNERIWFSLDLTEDAGISTPAG